MSLGQASSDGGSRHDGAGAVEVDVGVAGGGAVGDHGDGEVGGVGGVVEDLDVEDGGEAAEALGADAEAVDLVVELDAEFFDVGFGAAGDEVLHVDGVHEGLLGEEHGFFGGAADADAEHAGRAPAGAHGGDGFEDPVDDGVGGVEHDELGFGFGAAAFGCDGDVDVVAFDELDVDDGRGCCRWCSCGRRRGRRGWRRGACCRGRGRRGGRPASNICLEVEGAGPPLGPSQRTSMPTLTKTVTMPVSWQMGRWPSAHMRRVDEDLGHGVFGGVGLLRARRRGRGW